MEREGLRERRVVSERERGRKRVRKREERKRGTDRDGERTY
jgi:hypothetical protein